MAVYKLIPSSLVFGSACGSANNAYNDTDNDTYAYVTLSNNSNVSERAVVIGGFDVDSIPNIEDVVSITVRVKARLYSSGGSVNCYLLKHARTYGYGFYTLSNNVTLGTTAATKTFTLTVSVDEMAAYLRTCAIMIYNASSSRSESVYIYGAEIVVETTDPPAPQKGKNKILFGNQSLLDLTPDTVTTKDVRSGATFHLPSGIQSVGTLASPYLKKAAHYENLSYPQHLIFTGLKKEPSWFVAVCSSTEYADSARLYNMVYDGEHFYSRMGTSNGSGIVRPYDVSTNLTFTYSDGTLTILVNAAAGMVAYAEYELYYL